MDAMEGMERYPLDLGFRGKGLGVQGLGFRVSRNFLGLLGPPGTSMF